MSLFEPCNAGDHRQSLYDFGARSSHLASAVLSIEKEALLAAVSGHLDCWNAISAAEASLSSFVAWRRITQCTVPTQGASNFANRASYGL